jgi:FkbM family methyltransferase
MLSEGEKKFIEEIYNKDLLPIDHINYLEYLGNEHKFNPKVIYDIGSCVGHWTREAEKVWPKSHIILFDAYSDLEFLYKEKFYLYDWNISLLSDIDNKIVKFYQDVYNLGSHSYYRQIGSNILNHSKENYVYKITETLDTLVKRKSYPKPELIKIDVQGCEKDILMGATDTLKSCKFLIVEMQSIEYNEGAPKVDITKPYIESLGFRCIAEKFSDNGPDADYCFINNRI